VFPSPLRSGAQSTRDFVSAVRYSRGPRALSEEHGHTSPNERRGAAGIGGCGGKKGTRRRAGSSPRRDPRHRAMGEWLYPVRRRSSHR